MAENEGSSGLVIGCIIAGALGIIGLVCGGLLLVGILGWSTTTRMAPAPPVQVQPPIMTAPEEIMIPEPVAKPKKADVPEEVEKSTPIEVSKESAPKTKPDPNP